MQDGRASTNIQRQEAASRGYADLYRAQAKPLSILLACCALVASSYSESILSFLNQFASIYSFCLFVMLFVLVLPARPLLLSIPLAIGALQALSRVSELKISAVGLPITFFDVKTVIADPMILVNAIGIRDDLYRIASITAGVLIFGLVASAFYKIRGYSFLDRLKVSRSPGETLWGSSSLVFKAVTLLVVLIAAQMSLAKYGRFVHANLNTMETKLWQELWLPSSQVSLFRKLGVLEYVAFSSFAASEGPDISLEHGHGPAVEALRVTAAKFVNSAVHPSKALLPNIVFFHAESTFDPNLAFRLSARIELPLWSKQNETRALSPLRVNVIGGGSWVTEFEVITGVDSRIFGFQGYYTHYYIAPKVKNSFAHYLARKGYNTVAFYPVEGNFYNVEKAFKSYGFKTFTDGRSLGLPEDWGSLIDRDIIKAVIEYGAFKGSDPFFYFIGTSENHGPHPCESFDNEQQFLTTFAATVSFEENCQLNEYLRRATSTSDALELVLKQLKQIERETGRPFVLLSYGDHQPWSFTGGIYSIPGGTAAEQGFKNFSGVRTNADGYQTFFHLLASDNTVLRSQFTEPPPASLLPTLVSAFVATSYDDLYLPINLLAFASCGSDIRASGCARFPEIARLARHALLTEPSSRASPVGALPSPGLLPERPLTPASLQLDRSSVR
jgi:phosphoglycerol transferase MdoB-like AlkP superfamily enzyme